MSNTSNTNWAKIDAMTDDDINTSHIPPLADDFFSKAKLRMPVAAISTVSVSIDSETLAWSETKGKEAECTKNSCRSAEDGCNNEIIKLITSI
jgi:hypothetical protein